MLVLKWLWTNLTWSEAIRRRFISLIRIWHFRRSGLSSPPLTSESFAYASKRSSGVCMQYQPTNTDVVEREGSVGGLNHADICISCASPVGRPTCGVLPGWSTRTGRNLQGWFGPPMWQKLLFFHMVVVPHDTWQYLTANDPRSLPPVPFSIENTCTRRNNTSLTPCGKADSTVCLPHCNRCQIRG